MPVQFPILDFFYIKSQSDLSVNVSNIIHVFIFVSHLHVA